MATAWFLNLDAEDELAALGGYTPSAHVLALIAEQSGRAERAVAKEGDVVLDPGDVLPESARGMEGRAWCPTPRALRALQAAGASAASAPSLDVLRRANDRAFCAELGQPLSGAVYARTETEILSSMRSGSVLLKRAFSHAGRGRRTVLADAITEQDRAWIRASLASGHGLQAEPFVTIDAEYALHGLIDEGGAWTLRGCVAQEVNARGTWLAARPLRPHELSVSERELLELEGERVAGALAALGYFGPFGVDAYRYARADGALEWNPRSEINARYTMGWAASRDGA